ncbi:unnamed protein product [Ilex paraguariensis]|uniref:Uncharacterized protein n=1 Tax=Ilex paraguariensis TaxID=185542 RepID=A0ABC8QYT7_9AQUA
MAIPSNRSPSPVFTRPNPNPRNSQNNSTFRRSFSGNPFPRPSVTTNPRSLNPVTPANSPSDFAGRHYEGKEDPVSLRGSEEKENEKDQNLKGVKARSPAKNFMSPTISAASKFTPSPKKKILAERNEPVQTSISVSSGKVRFNSVNLSDITEDSDLKPSNMSLDQNETGSSLVESLDSTNVEPGQIKEATAMNLNTESSLSEAPLNSQNVSESLSEVISVSSDFVNVEPSTKSRPFSSSVSPIIAPLDADPSLPPYDPKTNYLSPRPQFLHYKPNPRIELYLNKEKGLGIGEAKQLEESFNSENSSDADLTEETQSEDSQKESEEASLVEMIPEEVAEPDVPEPVTIGTPISTEVDTEISKETVEVKRVSKLRLFTRSTSISLLLLFLIACVSVSVTDSPVIDTSVWQDMRFSKLYDSSEVIFAKENFDGLARNFKHWSANSVSYLYKLIPIPSEAERLGALRFSNLTALQEDILGRCCHLVDHNDQSLEEIYEGEVLEPVRDEEVEMGLSEEEEVYSEVDADDNGEVASESQGYTETEEGNQTQEAEVNEPNNSEVVLDQEERDTTAYLDAEPENTLNCKEQSAPISLGMSEEGIDLGSSAKADTTTVNLNHDSSSKMAPSIEDFHNPEVLNSPLSRSEAKFSKRDMLGIFLLFLALAATTAFIYWKQSKATTPNEVVHGDLLLTKKLISNPLAASINPMYQDKPSSQNWQTEVDVVGESCPSEMSSYQKSSSYSKKFLGGADEAQSHERKPRKNHKRESLASSSEYSMGSLSYGSFTTYEKISSKHASGEEEIVTPVRRSSRIRSQVTSP